MVALLTTHTWIYMLQDGSMVSKHSGEKTLKCDACLFIVVVNTPYITSHVTSQHVRRSNGPVCRHAPLEAFSWTCLRLAMACRVGRLSYKVLFHNPPFRSKRSHEQHVILKYFGWSLTYVRPSIRMCVNHCLHHGNLVMLQQIFGWPSAKCLRRTDARHFIQTLRRQWVERPHFVSIMLTYMAR